MTQQRISYTPNPPVQGRSLTICYDFAGSGITATTLRVTFSPGGGSSDHDVSDSDPCVTITVPGNAESITIEDLDGDSPTKSGGVSPS